MLQDELIKLAKQTAVAYALDPALVCSVVEQESNWSPFAIRYEPAFYSKYVEPITGLTDTELRGRAFSWGLMQVMGQVARENGFKAKFLSELCDPYAGLDIGCKVLAGKMKRAAGEINQGLLFWNGGSNLSYPGAVIARMEKYR